tara:strand:+ start:590 stop:1900 length:1311 start_codon:yes stop_codon:yes gene_type:complete
MAALDPAQYLKFDIIVKDERGITQAVDIRSSVVEFRYYEDLYSPILTATATIVATGNVQVSGSGSDRKTLIGGIPLVGGEDVDILMSHENSLIGILDLPAATNSTTLGRLMINKISNITINNNRESFTIHLISKSIIANNTNRVQRLLKNNTITGHVLDIMNDELNIIKSALQTSESVGNISYKGNNKKPFTVIFELAAKAYGSDTVGSSAGFVFYETSFGHSFRSIDDLILEEPRAVYQEVNAILSTYDPKGIDPKNKILAKTVLENNNLLENLQYGVFASTRTFFDPFTGSVSEFQFDFTPDDYKKKIKNLGSETFDIKEEFAKPSRSFFSVLREGSNEFSSTDVEEQANFILSQASMRYNTILNQVINIIVPMNLELTVGNTVLVDFPKTSDSKIDEQVSGKFLIKEMCHYSSTDAAYTSLLIVRDTYGRKQK